MHFFQGFYEEVSSPLLSEVDLRYPDNAVDFLTTNHFSQLFNGSEIVVAGRLTDNDLDNFLVEVFGQGVRRTKWQKFRENPEVVRMCALITFIFFFNFPLSFSLRTTSRCRARPVLWSGM